MNVTHNLWSAGTACLLTTLTCFAPFANSGMPKAAGAQSVPAAVPPDTISGTLVDHATNLPVVGAIVALEQIEINGVMFPAAQPVTGAFVGVQQPDPSVVFVTGQPNGMRMIDRIVATTTSGPGGIFTFTGLLPGGFFDVVADASVTLPSGATQTYAMTVTTTVPVGSNLGQVPLVPEFGDSAASGTPVQTPARVTTSASNGTPTTADIRLSALIGFMVQFTIPPLPGSTPQVTTAAGPNCPSGTACANYMLITPASSFVHGMFNPGGTNYTIPTLSGPQEVIMNVEGRAFLPGTSVPDCNPSRKTAGPVVLQGTIATVIPNLDFSGCQ